jgi:O-succinylbenzoate synthase
VRIHAVELIRVEMALEHPVVTSRGTHDTRPLLLIVITAAHVGETVRGIGECAALAEPFYNDEFADGAERILEEELLPRLVHGGNEDVELPAILRRLSDVTGHPMAIAAVEMALIDAHLRGTGRSLGALIGAERATVDAGVTIGIGDPGDVAEIARACAADGYRRIKVKIAPGADVDVLREVRPAVGTTRVSVDANGAYQASDGAHVAALRALDELGLSAIEQPFAAHDLEAHATLRRMIRTPIVLDESIMSLGDLDRAVAIGACDGIAVKPARLGGILPTMELCRRARAAGVELSAGGMFESGIGRAVALTFAASPGFTLPGDLGPSSWYFARDLTQPHVMVDGRIPVPDGPGIGVDADDEAIAAVTTRSTRFTP